MAGSISKFCELMDQACRVWSVGYDQSNRWDVRDGGETDCSALVITCLKRAGFDTGGATYTGNMSENLTARGWKRLPPNLDALQPGDILLNDTHHTCACISGHGRTATIAQASIDENGHASGGAGGDQTGGETNERQAYVYRHGWDCILRYAGASSGAPSQPASSGLAVDGWVGPATVTRWQQVMGTTADGVISGQSAASRKYHVRLASIRYGSGGSQLVRAVQRATGCAADGLMGPDTIRHVQARVGTAQDSYFGPATTSALQRRLNEGRF